MTVIKRQQRATDTGIPVLCRIRHDRESEEHLPLYHIVVCTASGALSLTLQDFEIIPVERLEVRIGVSSFPSAPPCYTMSTSTRSSSVSPSARTESFFSSVDMTAQRADVACPLTFIGPPSSTEREVQRPDSSRGQGVVIEDTQRPEAFKCRIIVVAEGEVPASMEFTFLHLSVDLMDLIRFTNLDHRYHPLRRIYYVLCINRLHQLNQIFRDVVSKLNG